MVLVTSMVSSSKTGKPASLRYLAGKNMEVSIFSSISSIWNDTFWFAKFFHTTQGDQKNFPEQKQYFFHWEMGAGSTAEFSNHTKQFNC